jgi:hypothetical protein
LNLVWWDHRWRGFTRSLAKPAPNVDALFSGKRPSFSGKRASRHRAARPRGSLGAGLGEGY